jgi:hypothetical protein
MIEIPFYQAILTLIGVFTSGIGIGYKIAPKPITVTTSDGYCPIPREYGIAHSIKYTKTLLNGKTSDVNCVHLCDKICTLSGTTCVKG